VFRNEGDFDDLALGFATFFLNRTNRSGILNGGVIGGRDQSGPWKIDARFNREELIFRIESIAKIKRRISLTQMDALDFLKAGISEWPAKTLIYLDPPYYEKGRDLYYDYYEHDDHKRLADFVVGKLIRQRWIVSYDNAQPIRDFYRGYQRLAYGLGYSAREAREGSEVIFFSDSLRPVPLIGPFKSIRGRYIRKRREEERFSPQGLQQNFELALRGVRRVGTTAKKQMALQRQKAAPTKAQRKSYEKSLPVARAARSSKSKARPHDVVDT
jgi:D12 class N6 adenine-specific DNA methyltransferase